MKVYNNIHRNLSQNLYTYICVYMCMYVYIYIYIYRQRYGSQKRNMINSIHPLWPSSKPSFSNEFNYQPKLPLLTNRVIFDNLFNFPVTQFPHLLSGWEGLPSRVAMGTKRVTTICGTQGSAWSVSVSSYNIKITLWCIKHPLFATSQCSVEAALWSPRLFT